jgi:hypothetical protein
MFIIPAIVRSPKRNIPRQTLAMQYSKNAKLKALKAEKSKQPIG